MLKKPAVVVGTGSREAGVVGQRRVDGAEEDGCGGGG